MSDIVPSPAGGNSENQKEGAGEDVKGMRWTVQRSGPVSQSWSGGKGETPALQGAPCGTLS